MPSQRQRPTDRSEEVDESPAIPPAAIVETIQGRAADFLALVERLHDLTELNRGQEQALNAALGNVHAAIEGWFERTAAIRFTAESPLFGPAGILEQLIKALKQVREIRKIGTEVRVNGVNYRLTSVESLRKIFSAGNGSQIIFENHQISVDGIAIPTTSLNHATTHLMRRLTQQVRTLADLVEAFREEEGSGFNQGARMEIAGTLHNRVGPAGASVLGKYLKALGILDEYNQFHPSLLEG